MSAFLHLRFTCMLFAQQEMHHWVTQSLKLNKL